MANPLFFTPVSSPAVDSALRELEQHGIASIRHISPEITHVLLEVPSFSSGDTLRNGESFSRLLERLPENVRIIGGGTPQSIPARYYDLLKDPYYAGQNAAITAQCALVLLGQHSRKVFSDMRILILGWGRIGKSLARALKALGASVTVYARKGSDRALLQMLGYDSVHTPFQQQRFDAIFNTVPHPLDISQGDILLDLASAPGLGRADAVCARRLPGRMAPLSSGKCIAGRILTLMEEGTL